MIYSGGCHCGAIQFEVELADDISLVECNCSICSKTAYLHLIVPKKMFNLLSGEDSYTTYTFDTHEAKHLFCKICGIKSFYIPRSHPNGVSINARCLNDFNIEFFEVEKFDGQNWEQSIEKLKKFD
ncbi:MAG: GFA family protein [Gammaproteobacteria bacterium]|nr:GFA family protein [Gammaproteobacteria bacterium]